jgi:hypothetical protein
MIDIISHEKVTATQLAKRMNISKAAIINNNGNIIDTLAENSYDS